MSAEDRSVTVLFEHGRWRHAGWAVFGVIAGGLLVWKLGVVGKVLGALLVLVGVYHVVRFVRTLLRPAGELRVGDDEIRLPRGLCSGEPAVVAPARVKHAYFLRRAVPWAMAGPILVIELHGDGDARPTFSFPRDWFASDADQRRVARALNRQLGRLP